MPEEPVPVRFGLEAFLRHLGAPPVDAVAALRTHWPDVVGPALAGPTRPAELVDGVLVVSCDDPAWGSQITWMEAQIKRRFAELDPPVVIDRLRVRITR
ncbi:MAG: DUF721 domain-containing protein [Acidimicrobiales bacterium]